MKIRTDFVTNSSSSSYILNIELVTSDDTYSVKYNYSDQQWDCKPQIACSAGQLCHCRDLSAVLHMLQVSIVDGQETYADTPPEFKQKMTEFCQRIRNDMTGETSIKSLQVAIEWVAGGEGWGWGEWPINVLNYYQKQYFLGREDSNRHISWPRLQLDQLDIEDYDEDDPIMQYLDSSWSRIGPGEMVLLDYQNKKVYHWIERKPKRYMV